VCLAIDNQQLLLSPNERGINGDEISNLSGLRMQLSGGTMHTVQRTIETTHRSNQQNPNQGKLYNPICSLCKTKEGNKKGKLVKYDLRFTAINLKKSCFDLVQTNSQNDDIYEITRDLNIN
jgi:hypothetical protein